MYDESKLPWGTNEGEIKKLLVECLEHHYGSLAKCVVIPNAAEVALTEMRIILESYEKMRSCSL